ncbi:MAG TPA: group III truncated hemoglobin [Saprospiraceae bacterium]|nr:group III truncated hemoglobin [Saprospiraceae bacterium]
MKPDISQRKDIELLINTFYEKVKTNAVIGYIFSDVAKVDWVSHMPVMYSFWASVLLNEQSYTGNAMTPHIALSKLVLLSQKEFDEWLLLFNSTVDLLFEGEKADEAKFRAENIARLMMHKIDQQSNGI